MKRTDAEVPSLRDKFKSLESSLSSQLVEREELIRGCLIAMLARKHVFMIGPPGTAKSLATEKITGSVAGANYFEWLMDMHTKPEDLFGIHKISAMEQDRFERNMTGMMPEANIVFLDEIWKSSGAILNALLKLMDESRRFYDGPHRIPTPIMSVFGASNEMPDDTENLSALFDRFMLRYFVGDIVDDANFLKMLRTKKIAICVTLTLDELKQAQAEVDQVDTSMVDVLLKDLRAKLKNEGFEFSPRRWREALVILQAHAWLEGRTVAGYDDLEVLKHVFWNEPKDRRKIAEVIMKMVSPEVQKALELLDLATQLHAEALRQNNIQQGQESGNKIKNEILPQFENLTKTPRIDGIRAQVKALYREILVKVLNFDR